MDHVVCVSLATAVKVFVVAVFLAGSGMFVVARAAKTDRRE